MQSWMHLFKYFTNLIKTCDNGIVFYIIYIIEFWIDKVVMLQNVSKLHA